MGKAVLALTVLIVLAAVLLFGRDIARPPDELPRGEESSIASGNAVSATHAFQDGIHRFSGVFLLPHSCFFVDQLGTNQGDHIEIRFTVTDKKGEVSPCTNITTRYPFTVLVEAAENLLPRFYLNGEEVPSRLRRTSWQAPAGTLIDPSVTIPSLSY